MIDAGFDVVDLIDEGCVEAPIVGRVDIDEAHRDPAVHVPGQPVQTHDECGARELSGLAQRDQSEVDAIQILPLAMKKREPNSVDVVILRRLESQQRELKLRTGGGRAGEEQDQGTDDETAHFDSSW